MPKKTWINVNGVYKEVKDIWQNVNGYWKNQTIPRVNILDDWKELIEYKRFLYNYGVYGNDWDLRHFDRGTYREFEDHIHLRVESYYQYNVFQSAQIQLINQVPIDVTPYNKLCVDIELISTSYHFSVGVADRANSTGKFLSHQSFNGSRDTRTVAEIDLSSVYGDVYIRFSGGTNNLFNSVVENKIYSVWLE